MITLVQNLLFFLYSKKKTKFKISSPINILKQSSNVLILLPEEKKLIPDIQFLMSVFDKIFKQKSFLISAELNQALNSNRQNNLIIYSKEQRNYLNLPKKSFIKFLQSKNFDTVIDCNLIDSNFHYWLTCNLNSKFKIGLYRKNSTLFNNLVLKVNNIESTRNIYENFLYILKL